MEFDVQGFLTQMDKRSTDSANKLDGKIDKLDTKLDGVVASVAAHETRLVIVENTRSMMRWLAGVVTVAALGGLADLVLNHYSKP